MEKKEVLSFEDFTILMLGMLAKNSRLIDLDNCNNKIACLPFSFKQNIENILCADNGWKEEFSVLIDIDDYFDDHFAWERKFSYLIKKILGDLNKNIECDLSDDRFCIRFTDEEVLSILNRYDDKLINVMEHFTGLLTSYIYTRKYQEKLSNYNLCFEKNVQRFRYVHENENNSCGKKERKFMKTLKK